MNIGALISSGIVFLAAADALASVLDDYGSLEKLIRWLDQKSREILVVICLAVSCTILGLVGLLLFAGTPVVAGVAACVTSLTVGLVVAALIVEIVAKTARLVFTVWKVGRRLGRLRGFDALFPTILSLILVGGCVWIGYLLKSTRGELIDANGVIRSGRVESGSEADQNNRLQDRNESLVNRIGELELTVERLNRKAKTDY